VTHEPFTTAERERFHNLLKLAAESPFAGERANALAAAQRLAARHGMTVDEAAAGARAAPRPAAPDAAWTTAAAAPFVHLMDWQIYAAKLRREAAIRAARARGLDPEAPRSPRAQSAPRANPARMEPRDHARVLLTETSLRLREIVDITGLDIYQVVGLKLMLRTAA